jgi:hypothetical protein
LLQKKTILFKMAFFIIPQREKVLAATHTVTAIQAFVTGAAANSNVSAGVACRRIALHIFCRPVYCIQTGVFFFDVFSSV